MDQKQAIAKLRKVIGKSFAYRADPKAPGPEERERRREAFLRTRDAMRAADEARAARLAEVLAADAEYQRLKAAHAEAKRVHEAVPSYHHKRISVGSANSNFFSVRAEGDTWAEVVEKVCGKVAT